MLLGFGDSVKLMLVGLFAFQACRLAADAIQQLIPIHGRLLKVEIADAVERLLLSLYDFFGVDIPFL